MRVLLDANVLLDSLLQRQPWCVDSDAVLKLAAPGKLELCLASVTLTIAYYVGRKALGAAKIRVEIRRVLAAFTILPVDYPVLLNADALPGTDFEDNVQIAVAVAAKLDLIVTRDPAGFGQSPLTVMSPGQLAARNSP